MTTPVLETRSLSRRFGGLHAVEDVSLTVERGMVLGVIGPNGAGKSTLLNLITGHVKPSAGSVLIEGRNYAGAKPWRVARAGVGRTFQIVKPFRDLTVRDNVAIGSMFGCERASSVGKARQRADAVLERVGLLDDAAASPGALSVAAARRLELARALAGRPRLLLLDEVMAGLRAQELEPALALVRQLRREGVTFVIVEHVMKAILSVSDDVLVLHEGRALTRGRPEEVMADERVVEAYLGRRYARRQRGAGDA